MSELNKQLSEDLNAAMDGIPEDIKAGMLKEWTAEARGAKKVIDMTAENQPG